MRTWVIVVAALLIVICCLGSVLAAYWIGGRSFSVVEKPVACAVVQEEETEQPVATTEIVATATATPEPAPTVPPDPTLTPPDEWAGDDFGPEQHFPGKVEGPAIAEIWNPSSGFCALVRILPDESLEWFYSGSFWQAGDANALFARWEGYKAEYLAKSDVLCEVFILAADVPQP